MTTEGPIQVAAGNDDAHENDGGTGFFANANFVACDAHTAATSRDNGGFRFTSVDIAAGSTIDTVDLEVYVIFANDDMYTNVYANDVDDAVDFSTDADVTTRVNSAATSASAQWTKDNAPAGFLSSNTDAVDLNAVIQEVIDRGGWASGQAIVMLLQGRDDVGSKLMWVRSYDINPAQAAKITIDYTGGGGGPPTLASRRLLSGTGR